MLKSGEKRIDNNEIDTTTSVKQESQVQSQGIFSKQEQEDQATRSKQQEFKESEERIIQFTINLEVDKAARQWREQHSVDGRLNTPFTEFNEEEVRKQVILKKEFKPFIAVTNNETQQLVNLQLLRDLRMICVSTKNFEHLKKDQSTRRINAISNKTIIDSINKDRSSKDLYVCVSALDSTEEIAAWSSDVVSLTNIDEEEKIYTFRSRYGHNFNKDFNISQNDYSRIYVHFEQVDVAKYVKQQQQVIRTSTGKLILHLQEDGSYLQNSPNNRVEFKSTMQMEFEKRRWCEFKDFPTTTEKNRNEYIQEPKSVIATMKKMRIGHYVKIVFSEKAEGSPIQCEIVLLQDRMAANNIINNNNDADDIPPQQQQEEQQPTNDNNSSESDSDSTSDDESNESNEQQQRNRESSMKVVFSSLPPETYEGTIPVYNNISQFMHHFHIFEICRTDRPFTVLPQLANASSPTINTKKYTDIILASGSSNHHLNAKFGDGAVSIIHINNLKKEYSIHNKNYHNSNNSNVAMAAALAAVNKAKIESGSRTTTEKNILIILSNYQNYQQIVNGNPPPHTQRINVEIYNRIKSKQQENFDFACLKQSEANYCERTLRCLRSIDYDLHAENIFEPLPSNTTSPNFFGTAATTTTPNARGAARNTDKMKDVQRMLNTQISTFAEKITSIDQFVRLNKYKTRRAVPQGCGDQWSIIVKATLNNILNANTKFDKSKWLKALILLPHMFFPVRAPTSRIKKHLEDLKPFNIEFSERKPDKDHQAVFQGKTNKEKHVENLALNNELGKACTHMMQDVERPTGERMPFDEMHAKLLEKHPRRRQQDHFDTTEDIHVAPIDEAVIRKVVKKMKKSAATAICGWCRNLMMNALTLETSIAADLGVLCSMIVNSFTTNPERTEFIHFDHFTLELIRAARLIGIPKDDGGVRPITISSFFAKLTGTALMSRVTNKTLRWQYAINKIDGAKTIGHQLRVEFQNGRAVLRWDISNAFGTAKRSRIAADLKENHYCDDIIAYFNLMYQPEAKIIHFGSGGKYKIINCNEGIRQGDAPSSFFFCLRIHDICHKIKEKFPSEDEAKIFSYMDDISITTTPELALQVADHVIKCFEDGGFKINAAKSSIICKHPIAGAEDNAHGLKIDDCEHDMFKVLGINITDNYQEFNETIRKRIDKFFNNFDELNVRTEIKHCLLALCGKPRLLYYCETTPPKHSKEIAEYFDGRMKTSFAKLLHCKTEYISDDAIHDYMGANIPNHRDNVEKLYENALHNAQSQFADRSPPVMLTVNSPNFTSPEESYDKYWVHYMSQSLVHQLPESQYILALAFKCNVVPEFLVSIAGENFRCDCDTVINTRTQLCDHINRCRRVATVDFAQRHTYVKSALRQILQQYGFEVINEPTEYQYNDGIAHRPDLKINNVVPPVAIDVTVVAPYIGPNNQIVVGEGAKRAADAKELENREMIEKAQHQFFPFAVENTGHFEPRCFSFIRKLTTYVAFHMKPQFKRDVCGAVSTALASYRAVALHSAVNRTRNDFAAAIVE